MILNNEIFDNCLSAFCRKLLFIWILKNHHFNEPFNKYFTESDDQSKDYNCSLSQAVDRAAFRIGFFGWDSLTDQKLRLHWKPELKSMKLGFSHMCWIRVLKFSFWFWYLNKNFCNSGTLMQFSFYSSVNKKATVFTLFCIEWLQLKEVKQWV